MPTIKKLPPAVIAKISAGQVIDRPANAVKELIENSIDAKATSIKIVVKSAGIEELRVIDDGVGMDEEDLKLSFQTHTTSKISSEDDMHAIKSFGFRGEALASISAMADVVIKSRVPESSLGYELTIKEGMQISLVPVGMPVGTEVSITNLFAKVPARKKFLKTSKTEFRHVLDVVINSALSNLSVSYELINEGRQVLELPKYQSLYDRLKAVLGVAISSNMFPLEKEDAHHKVHGYLAKPQISSETKLNQYIFINSRPVANSVISNAVKDAYGGLLDPYSHPSFVLFIELPYDMVDVNMHPKKEEVSFVNEAHIYDLIHEGVSNAISEFDQTYKTDIYGNPLKNDQPSKKASQYVFETLKENVEKWDARTSLERQTRGKEILQINNLFLATENESGIVLIDQHAAHERILYEQFLAEFAKEYEKAKVYELPEPLVFEVSLIENELLDEYGNVFEKLGFELSEFGQNTFKLFSVPYMLKDIKYVTLIKEVLDNLNSNKKEKSPNKKVLKTISYLACRGAIKAGDPLTLEQRRDLLDKLEKTNSNYTCPHGRPITVEVTNRELAKLFKRIK